MAKNWKIGLIIATPLEAIPFLDGLSLSQLEKKPFAIYANEETAIIISGIGKANAGIASSYLIWKYRPELILNTGAAGAVNENIKVGEIFHINCILELDRPNLPDGGVRTLKPKTIEGYKTASIATQDRPIITADDRNVVSEHADLVDMECASIVQACKLWNTNCIIFKIVSDNTGNEEIREILENIKTTGISMFYFIKNQVLGNPAIIN